MGSDNDISPVDESHSFVVRMRRNAPPDPGLQPEASVHLAKNGSGRLIIRVEHVNSAELSSHQSVEDALSWLRQRMTGLVAGDQNGADR